MQTVSDVEGGDSILAIFKLFFFFLFSKNNRSTLEAI